MPLSNTAKGLLTVAGIGLTGMALFVSTNADASDALPPAPTPSPGPLVPPPNPYPNDSDELDDELDDAPTPAPTPDPKPAPAPVPGDAPTPAMMGTEAHNAAIVVQSATKFRTMSVRGRTFTTNAAAGSDQYRKDLVYWLTDCAFWGTYRDAPTVLSASSPDDEQFRRAWIRIRSYVDRGMSLLPSLGTNPVLGSSSTAAGNANWQRWALAVAFRSSVRTVAALREGYKKGFFWLFKDPKGVAWRKRLKGTTVQGEAVEDDGLLGEAAVLMTGRTWPAAVGLLEQWPATVTKAFTAANGISTRSEIA